MSEALGVVSSIVDSWRPGDARDKPVSFNLFFADAKETHTFRCRYMFPVQAGDLVYAKYAVAEDGVKEVVAPPFAEVGSDPETLRKVLSNSVYGANKNVRQLWTALSLTAGVDRVDEWLCDVAEKYSSERDPDYLSLCPGIDPPIMRLILQYWHKKRNLRRLYLIGLTTLEVEQSGLTCSELFERATNNPYSVASIPVEKCRDILARLNREEEVSEDSKSCGDIVRYVWGNTVTRGWTCTPNKFAIQKFPSIRLHLASLYTDYFLATDYKCLYHQSALDAERGAAAHIVALAVADKIVPSMPVGVPLELEDGTTLTRKPAETSIALTPDQLEALQGALDHTVSIVTGGAGTGKSTLIRQLVENISRRGGSYFLTSFTGKAVSRLRQVTGLKSPLTIHRLLAQGDNATPEYIVIDEASMVCNSLFVKLMDRFPDCRHLVLVGDINQLPPIEAGSLMQQLVLSRTVPTYVLTTNHRVQTADGTVDGIVSNANRVCASTPDGFFWQAADNFEVVPGDAQGVASVIKMCKDMGVGPNDITVLTPFSTSRLDVLGALNASAQRIFAPAKSNGVLDYKKNMWRVGDRVMLTKNDAEIEVYNGEEGRVKSIDLEKNSIKVDFGPAGAHDFLLASKRRSASADDEDTERTVDRLTLSYAMSIHKSQGSEWDYVIVYVPPDVKHSAFINKNLVYTAITRAKKYCWLMGNTAVLDIGAQTRPSYRCENLYQRLRDKLEQMPQIRQPGDVGCPDPATASPGDDLDGFEFDEDYD